MTLTSGLLVSLGLIAICFGTYWNALRAGLVFDDHLAIEDNAVCDSTKTKFQELFVNDFWGHRLDSQNSNLSFRPLTTLTFRLSHWLAGFSFNAFNLHFENIALHAICTVLFYFILVRRISTGLSALVGALLFAVHPVHVEAVTGVVGRAELLYGIFALIAFGIYLKWKSSVFSWVFFVLFLLASFLSKESGISILGVVGAYDLMLHKFNRASLQRFSLLVAILAILLQVRVQITGRIDLTSHPLIRKIENPYYFMENKTFRALSFSYLQVVNAKLLFWPKDLCCEYGFNCIPAVTSFDDPRLYSVAALFGVTALVSLAALYKMSSNLVLCLAWLILPYLPVSHIVVSVGTMIAERCLYVPSMGVCLFVALFLEKLRSRSKLSFYTALMLSVFVAGLGSWKIWSRNYDWYTDKQLFQSAIAVCPNSAKHHQQYALALLNEKNNEGAKFHLERANSIYPDWPEPHYHLGRWYAYHKDFHTALKHLEKCVTCRFSAERCAVLWNDVFQIVYPNPTPKQYMERAKKIAQIEQWSVAMGQYRQAGLAYRNQNNLKEATKALKAALAIHDAGNITEDMIEKRREKQQLSLEKEGDLESACNIMYWLGRTYKERRMEKESYLIFLRMMKECLDKYDLKPRLNAAQEILGSAMGFIREQSPDVVPLTEAKKHVVEAIAVIEPNVPPQEIKQYKELQTNLVLDVVNGIIEMTKRDTLVESHRLLSFVVDVCSAMPLHGAVTRALGDHVNARSIFEKCAKKCEKPIKNNCLKEIKG
eukprot:PhF_6_TR9177/c1_g1_i2/m.14304